MGNILHVTVANKVATYNRRDGSIVCGNSDYSIQFVFDSEWEEHALKTARFKYNGTVIDVPFEGDTVAVPKLRNTFLMTVGVFAGDLHTTTPAKVPCLKSILCEDGIPPDPEPDVYARIMAMLNKGGGGGGASLPAVTETDNGKFLRVVDGAWAPVALTDASQEGG